jgi:hypothetical protein
LENLTEKELQKIREDRNFIKVAYTVSLQQFNELPEILSKHYTMFAEILV